MKNYWESSVFCARPFFSIVVDSDASFRFCCESITNIKEKSEKINQYLITKNFIKDVWNSLEEQTIRQKLIDEIWPESCFRCSNFKGTTGARLNVPINNSYPSKKISLDNLKFIEFRFSNLCNLACRMCNPGCSNMLYDEWNDMIASNSWSKQNLSILTEEGKKTHNVNWMKNNFARENIIDFLKHTTHKITFNFHGGEPTINEDMYDLLNLCIEENFSHRINLSYNTNLTILPKKLIEYWKKFDRIILRVSIDGYEKVNDYIRWPSKWSKIISNLEEVKKLSNVDVIITHTVSAYNIMSIVDFFNWTTEQNLKIGGSLKSLITGSISEEYSCNILHQPEILNIKVLPKKMKDSITNKLMQFLQEHNKKNNVELQSILTIIKYMNSDDWSHLFVDFLKFTAHMDKTRNQNIMDIMPELNMLKNQ